MTSEDKHAPSKIRIRKEDGEITCANVWFTLPVQQKTKMRISGRATVRT